MRTLLFEVNGQSLSKVGNFSGIIRGSKQYLKCEFFRKSSKMMSIQVLSYQNMGLLPFLIRHYPNIFN